MNIYQFRVRFLFAIDLSLFNRDWRRNTFAYSTLEDLLVLKIQVQNTNSNHNLLPRGENREQEGSNYISDKMIFLMTDVNCKMVNH